MSARRVAAPATATLAVLCALFSHQARAQDVEDILTRYYRVMGGLERLRAWQGMFIEGRYILVSEADSAVPVRAWYRAPNKKRYELSPQGAATTVYAFDGVHAWFCDPANGVAEPSLMPEEQARQTKANADEYPFIDYTEKGHVVELVGSEQFEGRDVFRLKLTRNNGAESFHLFDAVTGHEVKITIYVEHGGRDVPYETVLRDFRPVDGIALPFLAESWVAGRISRRLRIERVEVDPALDDSLFVFPGGSPNRHPEP